MDIAWLDIAWVVVFVLVVLACWVSNLLGLPGNWAMIVAALVFWYFMPLGRTNFHWGVLVGLVVVAVLGEVIEFAAGAAGAAKAGGSKRSAALAIAGSLLGGIVGMLVGTPVPVIGSVVAAILGASLGAMGGAMLGEHWKGRTQEEGLKVGQAAFWGRLWGTLGKVACGAAMLVILFAAMAIE
jgi:uncharacterized protein YqgC (DUF456 family)